MEPHRDVGWGLCGHQQSGKEINEHSKDVCTQVRVSRCCPRPALLLLEKSFGTVTQRIQQDAAAEGIHRQKMPGTANGSTATPTLRQAVAACATKVSVLQNPHQLSKQGWSELSHECQSSWVRH